MAIDLNISLRHFGNALLYALCINLPRVEKKRLNSDTLKVFYKHKVVFVSGHI